MAEETAVPATADTKAGEGTKETPAEKAGETSLLGSEDTAEKKTEEKPGGEASAQESAKDIEVKLPEGVEADAVLLDEFKPIAKELGLDSAKSQRLVDLAVKMQNRWAEKSQEHWTRTNQKWMEEVKSDKDVGGANLQANLSAARNAIKHFGGDALRTAIDELGVGNHPVLFRAFAKIGKALAEDSVAGSSAAGGKSDEEAQLEQMYPSMFKKED
jgi:hypothetical protein